MHLTIPDAVGFTLLSSYILRRYEHMGLLMPKGKKCLVDIKDAIAVLRDLSECIVKCDGLCFYLIG